MILYIIIITITTLLAYLAMLAEKNNTKKAIIYILKILTILFPSIIAGIRYGIGTDYLNVYKPLFESIIAGDIIDRGRDFEIGYILLNRIVILLKGNLNVVLFISSLITNCFIYLGLEHYKKKINVPLAYFFYMIIFYQRSFNLVRQMIALSIVFYAFKFLDMNIENKEILKYKIFQIIKYLIFVIIASLFQRTALIMILIPLIMSIYTNPKYKYLKICSYVILVIIMINFNFIGQLISKIESLKYYAGYFIERGENRIKLTYFIRTIPAILPYFIMRKKIQEDKHISLIFNINIIGSILLLLAYFTNTYGERLALYFNIFQIVLLSYYINYFKNNRRNFLIISTTLILITSAIWYNDYIYKKSDETIPYKTVFSVKDI